MTKKIFSFMFIILIIILFSVFISCNKKPDKQEIWRITQDYIKTNFKEFKKITFPEYKNDFIFNIEENKFQVISYLMVFEVSCCGSIGRYTFRCIVEFKDGNYELSDFKLYYF